MKKEKEVVVESPSGSDGVGVVGFDGRNIRPVETFEELAEIARFNTHSELNG